MSNPIRVVIMFINPSQTISYTVNNSDLETVSRELTEAMNNDDKILFVGTKKDGSAGGLIVNKRNVTSIEVKNDY